jgi:DNA-binding CsgD family transcriptional regulator
VFKRVEVALLQSLAAHLRHDAQMEAALVQLWRQWLLLAELAGHLPQGVFLLDERRRVLWCNGAGRELLQQECGLRRNEDGALGGASAQETSRLQAALQQPACNKVLLLHLRETGQERKLLLTVWPLRAAQGAPAGALAVAFDPARRVRPATGWLREIYRLTRTEARLAALLAEGWSLAECAAAMNITNNTARTHLKRIFQKTHTQRQGDLVRLLLAGAGLVNVDTGPAMP